MERRNFIKNTGLASVGISSGISLVNKNSRSSIAQPANTFNLQYAPHIGMFKHSAGDDVIDQLNFMADQGFTAFEDNEMRNRPIAEQEKMAQTMTKRGINMGVFVAHKIYWREPNLTSGKEEWRTEFLDYITKSVDVAKRVNAKWMTVVPGHMDLHLREGYQTANLVESLKRASDILEPHGLIMVLEPLNFDGHAGQFLQEIPQAYEICKAVDSPSCKILFDVYHQQITEGNLIPNIDMAWDEVAYFQVGDNPGRNEPTTGEINYKNVFKHIHSKGFKGIIGMEHGNSRPEKEGEMAVIKAYQEVDNF